MFALVSGMGGAALLLKSVSLLNQYRTTNELMEEYEAKLRLSRSDLVEISNLVLEQMSSGLEAKDAGLMMLPSFVDVFPSGKECGEYFAIDLGGTSLKVVWVRLGTGPGEIAEESVREWPIPAECYDTENGKLLAWIVDKTIDVIRLHSQSSEGAPPVIGLCYSFACDQDNLDHGIQLLWTKNFRGKGLLGKDIVQALKDEFERKNVKVLIPALMNDSVASLIGAKYSMPEVKAGVILGTGTNCAYIEAVSKIKTLPKEYNKRGEYMVINTEWGDAKLDGTIPLCEEDLWVDLSSANPGHGLFEKLISGLYIGDIARRMMLKLAEKVGCFCGYPEKAGAGLAKPQSFGGASLAAIYHDDRKDLQETAKVLQNCFGLTGLSYKDLALAKRICHMVATRSARLCAAALVAILHREFDNDPDGKVVISVDGSTFTKFEGYRRLVRHAIDEILDDRELSSRVEIRLADGSSVMGAAIVAALAS